MRLLLQLEIEEAFVYLLIDPLQLTLDVLSLHVEVLLALDRGEQVFEFFVYLLFLLKVLLHPVVQYPLLLTHMVLLELHWIAHLRLLESH